MSMPGLPTWTLELVAISMSIAGLLLVLALVLAAGAWAVDRIVRACTEFGLIIEFLRWREKRRPFDAQIDATRDKLRAEVARHEGYWAELRKAGVDGLSYRYGKPEIIYVEGMGPKASTNLLPTPAESVGEETT